MEWISNEDPKDIFRSSWLLWLWFGFSKLELFAGKVSRLFFALKAPASRTSFESMVSSWKSESGSSRNFSKEDSLNDASTEGIDGSCFLVLLSVQDLFEERTPLAVAWVTTETASIGWSDVELVLLPLLMRLTWLPVELWLEHEEGDSATLSSVVTSENKSTSKH